MGKPAGMGPVLDLLTCANTVPVTGYPWVFSHPFPHSHTWVVVSACATSC